MERKYNKKVLFLASWYPNKDNPTLGNFVQKHAELANEIANVDVLYAIASNSVTDITVDDKTINGLRTVIVYYPSVESKIPFLSSILKRESYLKALKKGYLHLNKPYDLVHLNAVFPSGSFATYIKKKFKIPYIATVHWTGFLENNNEYRELPSYFKKIFKDIFKGASHVFTVSSHLGTSLQKLNLVKEYSVLNNVVKSTHFYPEVGKQNKTESMRFLHISTFDDKHKNISGMLKAFSQLKKDFLLHLITEGEIDDVWLVLEKFKIPKEKCIVESKLNAKDIGDAMRSADCLVLFSNYETFSVVLAEAWMCGLPAIYSKCGGLTEINNPNVGVQIRVNDIKGLYDELYNFSSSNYDSSVINHFSNQFSEGKIKEELKKAYSTFSRKD